MRYREDHFLNQTQGVIEPIIGNNVLIFTAIIGLVIGIIFIIGGRYGKQIWITFWGTGLVIASVSLMGYTGFS